MSSVLIIFCCLLGLGSAWNQPSTCYVRSQCSSGTETHLTKISESLEHIREALETIADRLLDDEGNESAPVSTTSMPTGATSTMEATTATTSEPTAATSTMEATTATTSEPTATTSTMEATTATTSDPTATTSTMEATTTTTSEPTAATSTMEATTATTSEPTAATSTMEATTATTSEPTAATSTMEAKTATTSEPTAATSTMEATTATTSEPTAMTTDPPTASDTCGGPGWTRVAYINMTDPNQQCPQGLQLTDYSIRSCGRASTSSGGVCSSVMFPVDGVQYRQVCGRAIGYR
ncbi:uncharacterized protein LOC135348730 [Halichondria panicea]|uniref:uncharacterized protein LOC135348730 n=1 Tax=Halichondria panicea TaxID=6063 RepID=UPI00312BC003